ncbi:MAG TPA: hypothetical protein P5246_01985, partial [Candidatus Omnitrophota bacterium]|nr:hypothetical protein [Candidatus Omnitrophota bacterium]
SRLLAEAVQGLVGVAIAFGMDRLEDAVIDEDDEGQKDKYQTLGLRLVGFLGTLVLAEGASALGRSSGSADGASLEGGSVLSAFGDTFYRGGATFALQLGNNFLRANGTMPSGWEYGKGSFDSIEQMVRFYEQAGERAGWGMDSISKIRGLRKQLDENEDLTDEQKHYYFFMGVSNITKKAKDEWAIDQVNTNLAGGFVNNDMFIEGGIVTNIKSTLGMLLSKFQKPEITKDLLGFTYYRWALEKTGEVEIDGKTAKALEKLEGEAKQAGEEQSKKVDRYAYYLYKTSDVKIDTNIIAEETEVSIAGVGPAGWEIAKIQPGFGRVSFGMVLDDGLMKKLGISEGDIRDGLVKNENGDVDLAKTRDSLSPDTVVGIENLLRLFKEDKGLDQIFNTTVYLGEGKTDPRSVKMEYFRSAGEVSPWTAKIFKYNAPETKQSGGQVVEKSKTVYSLGFQPDYLNPKGAEEANPTWLIGRFNASAAVYGYDRTPGVKDEKEHILEFESAAGFRWASKLPGSIEQGLPLGEMGIAPAVKFGKMNANPRVLAVYGDKTYYARQGSQGGAFQAINDLVGSFISERSFRYDSIVGALDEGYVISTFEKWGEEPGVDKTGLVRLAGGGQQPSTLMIFSVNKDRKIEMDPQTLEIKEKEGVNALNGLGVLDLFTAGISPLEILRGNIATGSFSPEQMAAYEASWKKLDDKARQLVMKLGTDKKVLKELLDIVNSYIAQNGAASATPEGLEAFVNSKEEAKSAVGNHMGEVKDLLGLQQALEEVKKLNPLDAGQTRFARARMFLPAEDGTHPSATTASFFQQGVIDELTVEALHQYYVKESDNPTPPEVKFVKPGTSTVADAETLDSPFGVLPKYASLSESIAGGDIFYKDGQLADYTAIGTSGTIFNLDVSSGRAMAYTVDAARKINVPEAFDKRFKTEYAGDYKMQIFSNRSGVMAGEGSILNYGNNFGWTIGGLNDSEIKNAIAVHDGLNVRYFGTEGKEGSEVTFLQTRTFREYKPTADIERNATLTEIKDGKTEVVGLIHKMDTKVFELSSFEIGGGFRFSLEGKGSDFKDTSIAPLYRFATSDGATITVKLPDEPDARVLKADVSLDFSEKDDGTFLRLSNLRGDYDVKAEAAGNNSVEFRKGQNLVIPIISALGRATIREQEKTVDPALIGEIAKKASTEQQPIDASQVVASHFVSAEFMDKTAAPGASAVLVEAKAGNDGKKQFVLYVLEAENEAEPKDLGPVQVMVSLDEFLQRGKIALGEGEKQQPVVFSTASIKDANGNVITGLTAETARTALESAAKKDPSRAVFVEQVLVLSSEDEESKKMVLAQFPEGTQAGILGKTLFLTPEALQDLANVSFSQPLNPSQIVEVSAADGSSRKVLSDPSLSAEDAIFAAGVIQQQLVSTAKVEDAGFFSKFTHIGIVEDDQIMGGQIAISFEGDVALITKSGLAKIKEAQETGESFLGLLDRGRINSEDQNFQNLGFVGTLAKADPLAEITFENGGKANVIAVDFQKGKIPEVLEARDENGTLIGQALVEKAEPRLSYLYNPLQQGYQEDIIAGFDMSGRLFVPSTMPVSIFKEVQETALPAGAP